MKGMKKISFVILAFFVLLGAAPQQASASPGLSFRATASGTGKSIRVKKVTYEGEIANHYIKKEKGTLSELEVDFLTDVSWDYAAKVLSVKDSQGNPYRGYLLDTDEDGCDIVIANMKHGRTYTIVINGLRRYRSGKSCRLTLKVKIPKMRSSSRDIRVSKVSVDDAYGEVEVKFASKVVWRRNAKVASIKDNKGKSYQGYLIDRDKDECEIYIDGMEPGRTYKIKIAGVKARGASSFRTVTVTAKVSAHRHNLIVEKAKYDEDYDDGRMECTVSFDFNKDIQWNGGSYVLISDSSGKTYSSKASYVEWDEDECEVHLSGRLSVGASYLYEIGNVKAIGAGKYVKLKGSFIARY